MALPSREYEVLTFDCYGTLIDWEAGILSALRPILERHGVRADDRRVLELYEEAERGVQRGPYLPYREIMARCVGEIGRGLGFEPNAAERASLAESLKSWKPFPDAVAALKDLKKRFRLAVISNTDDDLLAATSRTLEHPFDWMITAQRVGSYKPSPMNFRRALEVMGRPSDKVLHSAQSLFHDVAPARALGLATVWVNRRGAKMGGACAEPDLEVPDLKTLANLLSSGKP
ncbi:MAG: haloacid dehalogenase type II [Elusimicrobia bacterium]|nr:haloacid dehalogenase type II [Elusimicrobiota bacterium]